MSCEVKAAIRKTGARTMAAAVVTAPGRMEVARVPVPQPGEGEVLIRVEGSGVCASNIPPWEGRPWFGYPMRPGALGHEAWGVIEAIGPDVLNLHEGDRVATLSINAYADYVVSPADAIVLLPDSLAGQPFPGEPLGCAFNVYRRSDIRAGQNVAIVGVGFLGAILTRLASLAGANAIAISRRPFSLEIARRMGAAETIPMENHGEIIERVKSLTGGRLCERVIEAAGKQWPLDLAGELTGERGRLMIAGYHQDGLRQVNMQLWNWRGLDVINAHERDPAVYVDGVCAAVDAVSRGKLDPAPLYTHRFALAELGAALETVRERPDGFMKALVYMGRE